MLVFVLLFGTEAGALATGDDMSESTVAPWYSGLAGSIITYAAFLGLCVLVHKKTQDFPLKTSIVITALMSSALFLVADFLYRKGSPEWQSIADYFVYAGALIFCFTVLMLLPLIIKAFRTTSE
ncbi:MAG: hypothetical protein AAB515_02755 [Patescibacteria group bacterium]